MFKRVCLVLCFIVLLTAFAGMASAQAEPTMICLHAYITYYNLNTFSVDVSGAFLNQDLQWEWKSGTVDAGQIIYSPAGVMAIPGMLTLDWVQIVPVGYNPYLPGYSTWVNPGVLPDMVYFYGGKEVKSAEECSGGSIGDGRVNDGGDQMGAPVAIFCDADANVEVWDISPDNGNGTLAFSASSDEISAALAEAVAAGQSMLVVEGLGNQLWATADGATVAVIGPDMREAGKQYRFDFQSDVCQ